MVQTITVTETITVLGIDPPHSTGHVPPYHDEGLDGIDQAATNVGIPAFRSTFQFIITTIAIYLATAAVTYLFLQTRTQLKRFYTGIAGTNTPEDDKATALAVAQSITVSHFLTVLVLVTRTRQALYSLAPISYEVCTLVLGMEAALSVVVGGVWGVIKIMEGSDEKKDV